MRNTDDCVLDEDEHKVLGGVGGVITNIARTIGQIPRTDAFMTALSNLDNLLFGKTAADALFLRY